MLARFAVVERDPLAARMLCPRRKAALFHERLTVGCSRPHDVNVLAPAAFAAGLCLPALLFRAKLDPPHPETHRFVCRFSHFRRD